jgi:LTXXQ motif family protein
MIRLTATVILMGSVVVGTSGLVLAQPMMGGARHGPDAGMMRHHDWSFSDPASYLAALKADLGVTPAQEPAWNDYAKTVQDVAAQMQGTHQTMYEAMGSASWQERRDMMNRMFDARQQAFNTVHTAAEKLLASLDASQRTKAATRLPGLVGPGHSMMGGYRSAPHAP